MNRKEEMFLKFRTMTRPELTQYQSAAMVASRVMDFLGVSTILGMLIFTHILTVGGGVIFLYIFSNISANIDETIEYLERLIHRTPDK
jgi:hypothetical protein